MRTQAKNAQNPIPYKVSEITKPSKPASSIGDARSTTLPVQHRICTYKSRGKEWYCYLVWCGHIQIKKAHIPGGSIAAKEASGRAALVVLAIARGKKPADILAMIAAWRREDLATPLQLALTPA